MTENTNAEIKKLFMENEDFRKELITNTKLTLEKFGIELKCNDSSSFIQSIDSETGDEKKCVCVNCKDSNKGFLICDF